MLPKKERVFLSCCIYVDYSINFKLKNNVGFLPNEFLKPILKKFPMVSLLSAVWSYRFIIKLGFVKEFGLHVSMHDQEIFQRNDSAILSIMKRALFF